MAQDTLKLNEFYELLEKKREEIRRMTDTYLVSLILNAEKRSLDQAELDTFLALSQMPLAITAGQTSEQFFAEHADLADLEVTIPHNATDWRAMLSGILFLASQKYGIPTERANEKEAEVLPVEIPKQAANINLRDFFQNDEAEVWNAMVDWLEARKSQLIQFEGQVYLPRFELVALIAGDKNDNVKNAALNYYIDTLPKKTLSQLGQTIEGRRADAPCFLLADLVPAISKLRQSRIDLTIEK